MAVRLQDSVATNIYGYNAPKQLNWSPYSDNGGSVVAIAGDDYAIIASDTRLSVGFSICSRDQSKIYKLTDKTMLGCTGCWCDVLTLSRIVQARIKMYDHEHNKVMSTRAIAQMISTMLYYKRFFPYYVSNIVAGLNSDGKGYVYSYDPVGFCEEEKFTCCGSASALLQPLLDNQIGKKNIVGASKEPVSLEKALQTLKDAFISATERDIYTGDGIIINVITKDGMKEETFKLRRD